MTDDKDELAELKARISELEAKVSPPKSTFVPMTDAEHRDWVHQMRERRMAMATPPSVVRYFADQDDRLVKEIALRDARAPTGRPGISRTVSKVGAGDRVLARDRAGSSQLRSPILQAHFGSMLSVSPTTSVSVLN